MTINIILANSLRLRRETTNCSGNECIANRTCEPLSSPSLSITCQDSKRRGVSCYRRVSPGTRANLICKEGYQQLEDPGFYSIKCEEDGIWDKCPFSCQPVCGNVNPLDNESDVGRYPWFATIFHDKPKNEPRIVCGGTIISDNVIITSAHCLYDEAKAAKFIASYVKVAVGTGLYKWNDTLYNTPYAQYYEVKQINVFPLYRGIVTNFRDDIGAIILKDKIKFNRYISPACLDLNNDNRPTELPKGTNYTLTGYKDFEFKKLEPVIIPLLPALECIDESDDQFKQYITVNNICVGNPNAEPYSAFYGYGGSGVMKPYAEPKTLIGIVSISLTTQGIILLTDISNYIHWIKDVLSTANEVEQPIFCGRISSSSNINQMCTIPPPLENGQYVIGGFDGIPNPGTKVPEWSVIKFNCNEGFGLIGDDTGICTNGQWSTTAKCLKKCKGLTSSSVQLNCIYNNLSVPCDEPVKSGTKAFLSCKRGYRLPYNPEYNFVSCEEDGTWDYSIYRCTAECGVARPKGISLVIKGQDAGLQDFPWHVGIYLKDLNVLNKYGICEIDRLLIPPTYYDIQGNYAQDIAILKLQSILEFSAIVRPICLEWDFEGVEEDFVAGTKGLVAGWGLTTEGGNVSSILKYVILPTVPRQTCLEHSPPDFRPFITADKFCAGYLNGTSVCKGDSGGGLAIPIFNGDEPVYFLRGIVSVGPMKDGTCDAHKYTAFTRVLSHINWIKKYRAL
ncbi:modular serine protease-like [Ctenocephalides felis]|uniref:modular serine protease-like n=1 Tax=Ctenocephalides felis TaxID=7515 RepID=UPI000E6E3D43|nr:modular serine protease-like [Ctenocephalides felis]